MLALLLLVTPLSLRDGAAQQAPPLRPGEAFVTRFSGVTSIPGQSGPVLTIDAQGVVGSIVDLRAPGTRPDGRHWLDEPQRRPVLAAETGQIFGVALDDQNPPNIYVTATSAFGLHRTPDNADWAPGMWGPGGPGGVYRLDAANGYRARLLARISVEGRENTGAALGNIAYDRRHRQLFVSDLETGMIHRLGLDGADRGRYDHAGRARSRFVDAEGQASASLPPIAFPPQTRAQVEDCVPLAEGTGFAQAPECWNFAPSGRRIWGLGVAELGPDQVRLFYAVASGPAFGEEGWNALSEEEKRNSVWSVRIGEGGAFDETDVRREFIVPDFFNEAEDVARAGYSHPVSDIAFPVCGSDRPVMLVSERGGIRNLGLGTDNPFASPNEARTIRYELDGSGVWQPIGRYDIGFYDRSRHGPPAIRANCAGGAAFGPGFSETSWRADAARPDQFVWITGDMLCSPDGPCNLPAGAGRASVQPASTGGPDGEQGDVSEVHGIQGSRADLFNELMPGQMSGPDGQPQDNAAERPGSAGQAAPQGAGPPVGPTEAWLVDIDVNVDGQGRPDEEELSRNDATMVGDIAIFQVCAPARPVYMVPPPPAPRMVWPAFGRIHDDRLSHARVASHGRRLSHFRFGSHTLDISHNRWQSHSPRLSHSRLRSHYRWYSVSHLRPLSPGHSRRLSPTHRRPLSPGHSRRLSPQHLRPLSPGHNRYTSPGHRRPLSPGHSRTASPGHKRPLSPVHLRAYSRGSHTSVVSARRPPQRPGVTIQPLVSPPLVKPPLVKRPLVKQPQVRPPKKTRPAPRSTGRPGQRRATPQGVPTRRIAPQRRVVNPATRGPSRKGPVRTGPSRVVPRGMAPRQSGRPGQVRQAPRAGANQGSGRPQRRPPGKRPTRD